MTRRSMSRLVAAFCFSIVLAAPSVHAGDNQKGHEHMHPPSGASGDLHKAMMEGMKPMHDMQMTGDVDKDFAAMMIKHHEQAIAMSKIEQDKGKSPELKAMAQKMAAQQQKEIEDLKRYAR
jgi:uncharacterized protein (DUF305 family)